MGCRQHQVHALRHLRSSRHHMADIVGAGCHPPSRPRTVHHSSSSVSPTEEDAHQPWTALVYRFTATASRPRAHILAHLRLLGEVIWETIQYSDSPININIDKKNDVLIDR